jgi:hypothetical protein
MAAAFDGSLNDKATAMHFQRIVGALVSSAVGAGRFYSEKVTQARDATARAADGGEDEHGAPIGLESKAQRTREFAADMAMQAYALLAAAHGAIDAYKDLTGKTGKPTRPRQAPPSRRRPPPPRWGSGADAPRGGVRRPPPPSPAPRGAQLSLPSLAVRHPHTLPDQFGLFVVKSASRHVSTVFPSAIRTIIGSTQQRSTASSTA